MRSLKDAVPLICIYLIRNTFIRRINEYESFEELFGCATTFLLFPTKERRVACIVASKDDATRFNSIVDVCFKASLNIEC
jgi:hypothetical protein